MLPCGEGGTKRLQVNRLIASAAAGEWLQISVLMDFWNCDGWFNERSSPMGKEHTPQSVTLTVCFFSYGIDRVKVAPSSSFASCCVLAKPLHPPPRPSTHAFPL